MQLCEVCSKDIAFCLCTDEQLGAAPSGHAAGDGSLDPLGYAVHIDGITGEIDPATQAALDKMAGLLRKKELIRTGNAGADSNGVIVDMRENPNAVRLPPNNVGDMRHLTARKGVESSMPEGVYEELSPELMEAFKAISTIPAACPYASPRSDVRIINWVDELESALEHTANALDACPTEERDESYHNALIAGARLLKAINARRSSSTVVVSDSGEKA